MKTLLVLMFMVAACTAIKKSSETAPLPSPTPIPSPTPQVIEVDKGVMLIIGKCTNCKPEEIAFIRRAEKKMNEVVVSECFQKQLTSLPLIQTLGRVPSQVVDSLIHAQIKIDVEMYYTKDRVLGYTYPNEMMEWINRRYMLEWSVCDLGSLLAHETSHKIGYDHDYERTKRRPNSVPYSINTAFEFCCTK